MSAQFLSVLLGIGALSSVSFLTLPASGRWFARRGVWVVCLGMRWIVLAVLTLGASNALDQRLMPRERREWDVAAGGGSMLLLFVTLFPAIVVPVALEFARRAAPSVRPRESWLPSALLVPTVYLATEIVLYSAGAN